VEENLSSPTSRSLELLRDEGWLVAVVERWIPGANIRQDLFGLFDLIAIRGDQTMAVQVTSASNVSSRIRKITESDKLAAVRKAGWWIECHGWAKRKGRWACVRREDLS
jgi:hypothetical protein